VTNGYEHKELNCEQMERKKSYTNKSNSPLLKNLCNTWMFFFVLILWFKGSVGNLF
jgi:hypothetical protein